ncbi:MAG TPA: YegS/Rv2252/BmrU family lipid kinase [Terriglobia bacterium]|nr:YegS/Rv2252/BmrU family lipid kinase [Terriglobia bacterium]
MKQATLIYNPVAGRNPLRRERQMQQARVVLGESGIAVKMARTGGPGAATELAREAAASSSDLVIACGGDGTIYEVINGLAHASVPLGILPGGTANIIAKELGLPHDPVQAARKLPGWLPQRIALGHVTGQPVLPSKSAEIVDRYFLSVAGVGFDAYVIHHLGLQFKMSLGVAAYVIEGIRQVLRYGFHPIVCQTDRKEFEATFAIVQRASRYAGWFRTAPNQSITNQIFGLSLFKSRSRFRYFLYGAAVLARQRLRDTDLIEVRQVAFRPAQPSARIFFELDGEVAGTLPATFTVAPGALTLLMPPRRD